AEELCGERGGGRGQQDQGDQEGGGAGAVEGGTCGQLVQGGAQPVQVVPVAVAQGGADGRGGEEQGAGEDQQVQPAFGESPAQGGEKGVHEGRSLRRAEAGLAHAGAVDGAVRGGEQVARPIVAGAGVRTSADGHADVARRAGSRRRARLTDQYAGVPVPAQGGVQLAVANDELAGVRTRPQHVARTFGRLLDPGQPQVLR